MYCELYESMNITEILVLEAFGIFIWNDFIIMSRTAAKA